MNRLWIYNAELFFGGSAHHKYVKTEVKFPKKKFTYVPRPTRLEALGKSLRINYLFYISILISALILKYDKQNTKSLKCIISIEKIT